MTSRELTGLLPLPEAAAPGGKSPWPDAAYRLAFGAIGWPWLLYSLWGGRRAEKTRLLERLGLDDHALPHLGSWKADTGFLHRIVDMIEELRPRTVVELGAGASTLVCAKALARHGGGRLVSYDQHAGFVEATATWLESQGASAELRHAPLTRSVAGWPGQWYELTDLPERIDLLIIDGPPWTVHPFVRGAAESLFDRLSPGAVVCSTMPRGRENGSSRAAGAGAIPTCSSGACPGSTKGTLAGRKAAGGQVVALPVRGEARPAPAGWRRAAAMLMLVGAGWFAHDAIDGMDAPAEAAAFIDEASSSHSASLARQRMASQLESTRLNRPEIAAATGIVIPALPGRWNVVDVQLYPTDDGMAVATVMRTDRQEVVTLFATRAETPAERNPLLGRSHGRAVAYWEAGELAYALTADIDPGRLLSLAAKVATPS